jgi:hypothetical protein
MRVLAQRLYRKSLLELIGGSTAALGALGRKIGPEIWTVACLVKSPPPPNAGRFFRSVKDHVDAPDKRSSFAVMIASLFQAIQADDYQAEIKELGMVAVKPAHTFKYGGRKVTLWELKYQNKDRIYFFAQPELKTIFLLLVYHKKDRNTPDEVKRVCEDDIKAIIQAGTTVEFC